MSRSPSDSFQQWVAAFCIIRFDLEQGQLIEECYPPGCLSHEEELDIAFSSFPDSISQNQNRSSIHDCIFFYRIQRRSSEKENVASSRVGEIDGKGLISKSTGEEKIIRSNTSKNNKGVKFLYGYVFNRQRHYERLKRGAFPPMVLGVTNLFFLKSLRNIPHVVSVGSPSLNSSRVPFSSRASTGRISGRPEGFGLQQLSLKKFSPSSLLSAVKLRRDGPLCLMTEHMEAIWTTYASIMKPDTSILNRLIDAGLSPRVEESMSVVNNEILRRHFLELNTNFLAPFGPYFKATTPSDGSSPFMDPPPLRSFDSDEFLASFSARGVGKFLSKRMKSNWLDLYRRFLNGPNFRPWFQRKRSVSEQEQHRLWRQARIMADIQLFIPKMSELEIVDSFNAIEKHLQGEIQQSGRNSPAFSATHQKLKRDLQAVFNVLPEDMQQLLLMNPERAALLQSTSEFKKLPGRPSLQIGSFSSSPR